MGDSLREAIAREINDLVSGSALYDAEMREAHKSDQMRAADAILALLRDRGLRIVPVEITPEMAQALESNIMDCLPPSEVHRANWRDAWKLALDRAP